MKKLLLVTTILAGLSLVSYTQPSFAISGETSASLGTLMTQDETNNVTILSLDDQPKNSDAAYQYSVTADETHRLKIQITSKSPMDTLDLSMLTLSANWSGAQAGSATPLPDWIEGIGLDNTSFSDDGKSLTFDLHFSINQAKLQAALGSLNNLSMLTIRIATNFGNTISQNAGTITFETIIAPTTQPSESTGPSDSTEPSESTGPSESTEPSESTVPSDSTEPSDSTTPSETEPTVSSESTEPTVSSETATSSESTVPSEPATSSFPIVSNTAGSASFTKSPINSGQSGQSATAKVLPKTNTTKDRILSLIGLSLLAAAFLLKNRK
ncbi:LPXTG cell wall anchor domain-containing protein [Enterococcus asini]|uniref:LPXTG cell wall anchor domain-containing protein n=1 Tax=Enterococcus asini TaxID=57732 RepID=UPI00288F544B|nr:LPXTG cell wall anchor domain-containing protein [Enterococcus asini]MDT2757678.1 LPXTG cell wall anchor domain-containing protein [Enterococcus asini]